jgi:hypothetical protein
MIGFCQRLPSLTWWNNGQFPLSREWLVESIRSAAKRAGRASWGMEEDLVAGVTKYLEEDYALGTIGVWQLEQMVVASLRTVGEYDVANCCKIVSPRVVVCVPELAAYTGCELMFFKALRDRLREALALRAGEVRLEGLRHGVKLLVKRIRWRKRCAEVEREVLSYVSAFFSSVGYDVRVAVV